MKLKIAQVIGLNTDQKAAQVTTAQREDNSFFAVIELTCDDAFTKGRQVLSELEDFYFETEGSVAEKLNATFKEAENKVPEGESFSLGLAAISGKVLYMIGKGEIEVYLKRTDKLSPLLSVGQTSQLISGFIMQGDRLLFATNSLISFLGAELEKSLNLPVEMFEEEVESKIGASDLVVDGLAALSVEVLEEDLEIAPLVSEEEVREQTGGEQFQGVSDKPKIILGFLLNKARGVFGRTKGYFPKSNRGRLAVAVVLILIIASGAGYQYKSSRDVAKNKQFNQILQEARDDFNAAKGLATLNPADAKSKLDLAAGKVNQALVLKPADKDAQDFKKQVEQDSPSILQQSSVSAFPEFLDLDLVKKNFRATRMSLSNGKLLLFDPGVKTLVLIDIAKKSNQILAGSDQLGEASVASLNGNIAFVYSQNKGIIRIDANNSKVTVAAKQDSQLGSIGDVYGFAGNVYILDTDNNQIWKYLATAGGYSDKREYLNKDIKADFNGAVRMQIESSIYILKSGGEILRFTKGDKDNFFLSGLPSGVKDPKSFFVSSDTENLYLLDSGNSRLLTLTKTGTYKGEVTGSKFATATDLVVDEVLKKVYLLEGSKIYSVDLK